MSLVGPRLIVTAEHVIDGAREIVLKQRGKRVGRGTVIGYDLERDVALVRSDIPIYGNEFVFAERAPRLGEEVAAIGFPLGLPLTVTHGFVSGLNRNLEIEGVKRRRLIPTDAAVNPGNSGGPLIALGTREVMGLVSAGSLDVNAIAFAIPSQTVSRLVTAWTDSPQPVSRPECAQSGRGQGQPAPNGGNGADTYQGNFASFDRLERCYADDGGAFCTAGPSGQGATLVVGFDANYDGVAGSSDLGGPAMQMGTSFTTPGGAVTCDSSSRGITCTDNVTGSYFVIGDYSVVINNGGGEKRYATVQATEPQANCHPSYSGACLDPNASDYDCAGGEGNGPEYTGTVTVIGPDEFDLDADGDGLGCE